MSTCPLLQSERTSACSLSHSSGPALLIASLLVRRRHPSNIPPSSPTSVTDSPHGSRLRNRRSNGRAGSSRHVAFGADASLPPVEEDQEMIDAPGPSIRRSGRSSNGSSSKQTNGSAPSRKGKERATDLGGLQTPGRKAKAMALEAMKSVRSDDEEDGSVGVDEGDGDATMMEVDDAEEDRQQLTSSRNRTRSSHPNPTSAKPLPRPRPRKSAPKAAVQGSTGEASSSKAASLDGDDDDGDAVEGGGDEMSVVDRDGEKGKEKGVEDGRRGTARRKGLRKISSKPIIELTEDEADEDEGFEEEGGEDGDGGDTEGGEAMEEDGEEEDGDQTIVQDDIGSSSMCPVFLLLPPKSLSTDWVVFSTGLL
jgi:hypothetical protein